jgi:guanylate kinase
VNYDKYGYILVNEILDRAVHELEAIVQSERILRSGKPLTNDDYDLIKVAKGCLLANSHEKVQPVMESF